MNLYIFCTDKDHSAILLHKEALKKVSSSIVYYHELIYKNNQLYWKDTILNIIPEDKIIIRWPWDAINTKLDYNFYVRQLIDTYYNQIILDKECLKEYSPFYEDKLFQAQIFGSIRLPQPKTIHISSKDNLDTHALPYPFVIKKRISSRAKGNFIIHTTEEYLNKTKKTHVTEFIMQEYVKAVADLRVLIFKGEVVGVVKRYMHLREAGRLGVKGMEKVVDYDTRYHEYARLITNSLKADLIGLDILIDEQNNPFIIEANLSPQFESFSRTSGINVAEKVIEKLL